MHCHNTKSLFSIRRSDSLCLFSSKFMHSIRPGACSGIIQTGCYNQPHFYSEPMCQPPEPRSYLGTPPLSLCPAHLLPASTTHTPVTIPHWNPRSLIIRLSMAHIKRTTSRPSAHKLQTISGLIDMGYSPARWDDGEDVIRHNPLYFTARCVHCTEWRQV